jgi:hypothetical protein
MNAGSKSQFESARLKVQRAYLHIQELERVFATFLQSNFCKISVEQEPETGQQLLKVASIASLPAETPLIIGDAFHNLRTALDHVMAEILKGSDGVYFPVGKERQNFEAHSTYRTIKKALPDLAAMLLDDIMPYDTGKPSIWAASRFGNIDKHNLLIATTTVKSLTGVSLEHQNLCMTNSNFIFDQGGVVRVASMPPGPVKITNHGNAAAQILFNKGRPLEGQPVIESLTKMAQLTLQTIEALELFWFAKP